MNVFTVKQQYYTGNYDNCLKELSKIENNSDETYLYYKYKSLLATDEIESIGSGDQSNLSKLFSQYVKFLETPSIEELSKLEESVFSDPSSLFSVILLGCAYCIVGEFEKSYKLCVATFQSVESSKQGYVELFLLLIQSLIYLEDTTKAKKFFEKFLNDTDDLKNEDEIITSFIEGYLNFNTHTEVNNGSTFYFFEDLNHTNPSYKTNLMLLNLHLQNKNAEEAESIIKLLESEFYIETKKFFLSDLLVSKISLGLLKAENVDDLRQELLELDPSHSYSVKHNEISSKLDAIIEKYN